jgi:hypothetical protein
MSRKRATTDQEPAEAPTAVAEPSVTAPVAEATVGDVPAADVHSEQPSFADKVGQKKFPPIPDPFGIATDVLAGVRLFESRKDRQTAIKFGEGSPEDKPSQPVIDKLKEAGYRWNPLHKIWAHPVRAESALATRIEAEQLFQDISRMIRREKGIEATPPQVAF